MTSTKPRLTLLGRISLDRGDGDAELRFLSERRFRLLAYLALRRAWVGRDELATLFWPNRSQAAARNNLRKLLLEVRQLDLPLVESDRNAMRWIVDSDVADFDAALAGSGFDAALTLYLGPAMPSLDGGDSEAFSAWLHTERLRLHNAWRDAAVAALPSRSPAAALRLARTLLEADPFDEDAVVAALDAHRALGDHAGALADLRRYAERLLEAFGVEPSARVRAALDAVPGAGRRAGDLASSASLSTTHPARHARASDGFVGRIDELQELAALLRNPECRLLTITGPGGMGKSRLVKEALRGLTPNYAEGVVWIALDDLTDVAQVAPRVATELGLSMGPNQDPTQRVATALAGRHTLMILDNSEHLPRLSVLVERLLDAAPCLQLLCTSRTRIGVPREWLLPLQGLAVPSEQSASGGAAGALAGTSDAVRLFVAQALATDPRFDVAGNGPHIARLVRALGGLPLAILLAASWVRLLPVVELIKELALSLDVLESPDEGEERPEHRSVRATFEQSWRRLAAAEQRALTALSMMVGSFQRRAATELAQAPLPLLAALVDKSLLQVDDAGRFSMHPLIQQFAAEKLAQDPSMIAVLRDRHAETFAQFMTAYLDFESVDQPAALTAIGAELGNLLAAWHWAIERANLDVLRRCCSGLSNYFQAHGPIGTGVDLMARAELAVDLHADSAQGLARNATWGIPIEHAAFCYWLGDYDMVETCARKGLQAARDIGHAFAIRTSLNTLALGLLRKGQPVTAVQHLEEALARAQAAKAAAEIPAYAGNLVHIRRELGDDTVALQLAREALIGHRANGHLMGEISMTNELGQIHHNLGQLDQAIDWYEQGLRLAAGSGVELRRIQLLTHLASSLLDAGALERARLACDEAIQVVLQSGLLAHEPACRGTLANVALAQGDLPETRKQLRGAVVAARRIGTALVVTPVLRDCALYFERTGNAQTALHCLACAEQHAVAKGSPLPRYRGQRERLLALLDVAQRDSVQAHGAALSLQAGLALAEEALGLG